MKMNRRQVLSGALTATGIGTLAAALLLPVVKAHQARLTRRA